MRWPTRRCGPAPRHDRGPAPTHRPVLRRGAAHVGDRERPRPAEGRDPRAGRVDRPRRLVDHGRCARQRRRGLVARAGRCAGLRGAAGPHPGTIGDLLQRIDRFCDAVPRTWATANDLGPLKAVTRVLVESTDHAGSWTTVGVHGNVVEASWLALVDALAYAALRARTPAR